MPAIGASGVNQPVIRDMAPHRYAKVSSGVFGGILRNKPRKAVAAKVKRPVKVWAVAGGQQLPCPDVEMRIEFHLRIGI